MLAVAGAKSLFAPAGSCPCGPAPAKKCYKTRARGHVHEGGLSLSNWPLSRRCTRYTHYPPEGGQGAGQHTSQASQRLPKLLLLGNGRRGIGLKLAGDADLLSAA